jgi:transposase
MSTGKTYSMDLRERVIEAVNKGIWQLKEIAKLFNINVKTIYKWRKNLEKTGTVAPKTGFQKGHSHKITDLDAFKNFIKENPDLTLKEMAQKFGNVSPASIRRALKKINFTRKKNNSAIKNVMKKKEKNF